MKKEFKVFLGIDQTGAVNAKNEPRPLSAAVLWRAQDHWILKAGKLKALKKNEVQDFLSDHGVELELCIPSHNNSIKRFNPLSEVCILLDSVIGLPESCTPPDWTFKAQLESAQNFQIRGRHFGQAVASEFFKNILDQSYRGKDATPYPKRRCEILAKANSVFQTHPHQKNIGCGTYRSWKELSEDTTWFQTLLDPSSQNLTWILEVYPSLFWKQLGYRVRSPKLIAELLAKHPHVQVSDSTVLALREPNLADAAVCALAGLSLQMQGKFWNLPEADWVRREGWILGLED